METIKRSNAWNRQLGQNLRQARRQLKCSQTRAATFIGVTYQMVQKYEKGTCRIPIEHLCALAKLYGISPLQLFPE